MVPAEETVQAESVASMAADPRGGVQIRLVQPSDYSHLARFLSTFAGETRPEEFWLRRFNLWWNNNPAFREDVPRGWIVAEDEAIKGFLGNVPTLVQLSGVPTVALSTTTWRVLPAYRNHSLRLLYESLRCARQSIFFDTTPSEDAARIVKSLKFHLLPHLQRPRRSIIILNPQKILRLRTGHKTSGVAVGRLSAFVVRAAQACRLRLAGKGNGAEVRQLNAVDTSFDEMWDRTCHLYPNTSIRTASVIHWQCFANDDFRKLLFGCFHAGGLVGYLVASGRIRDGLRVLCCQDIWLDPDAPSTLAELLAFVRNWAKRGNHDLIEISHFDQVLADRLSALGLFERSGSGGQPAYYKLPSSAELDPARSYFVDIQGDRGL